MSKIGKIPVIIKEGVTVSINNGEVVVSGPKGTLVYKIPSSIDVKTEEGRIFVTPQKELQDTVRAVYGLTRAILANMVKGVSEGFQKKLELTGVGYRASVMGKDLSVSVGFSHPVKIAAPEGIQFAVLENTIVITGIDKVLVGNTAASIRAIRPPEPYKGKGIKYAGEKIRRKAGKAAKAVGSK
ncbi:MAG: 50S ribosomal protein L6 [Candidatus Levyibacteriota bacterium]|nr:MAG: 50S ribosomal protein L6 [Candidatus Levybacteria bacterium]